MLTTNGKLQNSGHPHVLCDIASQSFILVGILKFNLAWCNEAEFDDAEFRLSDVRLSAFD